MRYWLNGSYQESPTYLIQLRTSHFIKFDAKNFTVSSSNCHSLLLEICRCLAQFEIYPTNSTDETGRLRFHSDNPFRLLNGDPVLQKAYLLRLKNVVFGSVSMLSLVVLKFRRLIYEENYTFINAITEVYKKCKLTLKNTMEINETFAKYS